MWTLVHEMDEKENPCPIGVMDLTEVEYEGEVLDGTEHECNKEDAHDGKHVCECGLEFGG